MHPLLRTRLGWLRIIALLEGLSFLILLFIAMPLKYLAGEPGLVRSVGMAHGVLFMAYVPLVFYVQADRDWPFRKACLALIASVLPFGTFWAELKLFREPAAEAAL